jgi:hypothetical protein
MILVLIVAWFAFLAGFATSTYIRRDRAEHGRDRWDFWDRP